MTHTERILNLLEINENLPALVVDEESNIVSCNNKWQSIFHIKDMGNTFFRLFDKNVGLLLENSFSDCKIFQKVQRREIYFTIDEKPDRIKFLVSPFKIDEELYYYILLYGNKFNENLLVYPSVDNTVKVKFEDIISTIQNSYPQSLIEKKNLQFSLDIEKTPLAIKEKNKFSFTNSSFDRILNIKGKLEHDENNRSNLLEKIDLAQNELYINNIPLIIEEKDFVQSTVEQDGKVILFPIDNKAKVVEKILVIGSISKSNDIPKLKKEVEDTMPKSNLINENLLEIKKSSLAKLIYNKNNFDILDANSSAAELYGYGIEELKQMNITQLFLPEEMQKLISPDEINGKYIFNQLRKDGSNIEVSVEREYIVLGNDEACIETIRLNQPEEEVIDLHEYEEEKTKPSMVVEKEKKVIEEKTKEKSDFLSTLFHELLTPVNVILGFVQEIVDSIEKPTEEQEESAQIIKDNQHLLLQTMNTAVQYAQLEEGQIQFNSEKFEINKYLIDLKDSISRLSEKENKNIVFENIPETISLEHDRAKLLAAISYFIKFVTKLTDSENIFVSFKFIDGKLYTLIKDEEDGISNSVLESMLDIYNSPLLANKKSYGISPITVKLSQTLNKLLALSVMANSDTEGKSIALVTSPIAEQPSELQEEETPEKEETFEQEEISEEKAIPEKENNFEEEETVEAIPQEDSILPNDNNLAEYIAEIENEEPILTGEVEAETIEKVEVATTANVETITKKTLDLSNYSCLFIDDSIDTQLLFKSQMEDFKLLKICSNLTEAFPLLNKYNFDLIIVDINLNDTYNGFDALKIIRQFNNYKETPIVAVTAYPFDEDKKRFINYGFNDYLVKPLLKDEIINSLEEILR